MYDANTRFLPIVT